MSATWRDLGRCAETDPETFFPDKGHSVRPAKEICIACEVRVQCLAYALETRQEFGVWGGLSWPQRLRLLRQETAA